MPAFVVAYDLHKKNPDYEGLIAAVNELYPRNCHLQMSVWIIIADATAQQICDHLADQLTARDSFFVSVLGDDWSPHGYPQNVCNWLRANL